MTYNVFGEALNLALTVYLGHRTAMYTDSCEIVVIVDGLYV